MSGTLGTTATLNLNDGVIIFNNALKPGTSTPGSTIQFDGGTWQTNANKPIAFVPPASSEHEFGDGSGDAGTASAPVRIVDSEDAMFRTDKEGALELNRGEVFLQATDNATIKTTHALPV